MTAEHAFCVDFRNFFVLFCFATFLNLWYFRVKVRVKYCMVEHCQPHSLTSPITGPEWLHRTSAGSAFSWCAGGRTGHRLSLSGLLCEQRLLLCLDGQHWEQQGVWLWHSQANGNSGHTCSCPFIEIMFGPSANCWELAGVRRGEDGGLDSGDLWTKDRGRKRGMWQGSGRWWLIRDWTARTCLFSA